MLCLRSARGFDCVHDMFANCVFGNRACERRACRMACGTCVANLMCEACCCGFDSRTVSLRLVFANVAFRSMSVDWVCVDCNLNLSAATPVCEYRVCEISVQMVCLRMVLGKCLSANGTSELRVRELRCWG